MDHDLIVIGGGSAGLTAARIAAGIGARVALVEREQWPGGDCLWTGCVPSKALISIAQQVVDARSAASTGVVADDVRIDFAKVMAAVHEAQEHIRPHDAPDALEAAGVTAVRGTASVRSRSRVDVSSPDGERVLTTRHVLIATGSHPLTPPIPGIDQAAILTTDDLWQLRELPGRLLVVGGGPIGCELGQAFARLGSRVTIVEASSRLVSREEPGASTRLLRALQDDGVEVQVGFGVDRFEPGVAVLADGSEVPFDRALVAIGRRSAARDVLDSSLAHLLDDRGQVRVDSRQRSAARGIWAAGDVTGQLPFTNAAGMQGANAALNALLGTRRRFDATRVPWVTFTDPEIGRVGLTLEEARERFGDRARAFDLPLSQVDRAVTSRATDGSVRLVTDRGRRLLGATVVGRDGGELMVGLAGVIRQRGGIARLAGAHHPYPTMGEATQRAALELRLELASTPRMRRVLTWLVGIASRLT